jgi:DNA-binding CsgD family transcriptional regulator
LPALSSDQARANGAQPRMSELELQRLLHACAANDKTNAELAAEFGKAPSTVYNIKVKYRDQIEDIRRKWTVQFEDLWMTRKQARLDDIQELRDWLGSSCGRCWRPIV